MVMVNAEEEKGCCSLLSRGRSSVGHSGRFRLEYGPSIGIVVEDKIRLSDCVCATYRFLDNK